MGQSAAEVRLTAMRQQFKDAKAFNSRDPAALARVGIDLIREADAILLDTQSERLTKSVERFKNNVALEVFGVDREKRLAELSQPVVTAPLRRKGVDADFLNSFTSSLDEVTQYANGYGELKSAVVESEDNGTKVTATYDGRNWSITF